MRKIGIFGGSFDPVHNGHRALVVGLISALKFDEIRIIPASRNPLKSGAPQASDAQRLHMLQLAFADVAEVVIDDRELRRGTESYTVETLRSLKDEIPDAELFLILGSDNLETFARWREPKAILDLATPVVITRAGSTPVFSQELQAALGSEKCAALEAAVKRFDLPKVSASELRTRFGAGEACVGSTPELVRRYIFEQKIYEK